MGQRHTQRRSGLTIDDVVRRLGADDLAEAARAAFDRAGEPAAAEHGRPAAVLGSVRLASRRIRWRGIAMGRLASTFDVEPDAIRAAELRIARRLSPPADDDEVRTLRRRLVVAYELLSTIENGRVVDPEFPGSYLADAAPDLLARAAGDRRGECDHGELDESALRAHVERLEADLAFAKLGTTLYASMHGDEAIVRDNGADAFR